ncbi:unnamed protein product [Schistosoma mattheei]|uniref:Reverse transcriptase domain-containing protein n=1 Tax=Schistosoma mattheei TaxID=31246 RepID=A0AA85BWD0_9TREM|nr:unnamed protein product [Schistosoma mattheei]
MLPPNTRTEAVFLKPRAPFKLAAFNVHTFMQVGQQIGLAMSLESLNIDVCCLSETHIQDSGEALQIRSPSVASKSLFYVRLSGDPVASSSGLAGVGVALSARAEAALVDWIPINSRLCAVRLESSIKVRRNRQGCPISPFLFNFAIDDILETALMGVSNGGVDLLPGERLLDLEYADDIVLLCDNAQGMQSALNQLAISVRRYGMCFGPSKCKVLLQDWQDSNPVLTLDGEQIDVVEKFVYLGSCISAGGV